MKCIENQQFTANIDQLKAYQASHATSFRNLSAMSPELVNHLITTITTVDVVVFSKRDLSIIHGCYFYYLVGIELDI